jgi:hypothetical protein
MAPASKFTWLNDQGNVFTKFWKKHEREEKSDKTSAPIFKFWRHTSTGLPVKIKNVFFLSERA